MQIDPYLMFKGDCEAAFTRYAQVLGGQLSLKRYRDMPDGGQVPDAQPDQIMHARLDLQGQALMGSDSPARYHQPMQGVSVSVSVDNVAEGRRIFEALSDAGSVHMAYESTFWAEGFGMCVDRFGTAWMVNAGMNSDA